MIRKIRSEAVSNILGYTFAFSIASLIMMSSVLITTNLVDEKTSDAVALKAQSIANQIADAIVEAVAIKQTTPDVTYQKTVALPAQLIDSSYYIDITQTAVYVNTTNGRVSRSCSRTHLGYYDFGVQGRIPGDTGSVVITYEKLLPLIRIDFGTGNITRHSPVASGYFFASNESLINSRDPEWWDYSYPYRIPILINNTVPPEYADQYYASNLTDTVVRISITKEDIDYGTIKLMGDPTAYFITNAVFYDPDIDATLLYSIDFHKPGERTIFFVNMSIGKNETKLIYLYYGISADLYYHRENTTLFYDNFAQHSQTWNKTYDGSWGDDIAHSVAVDPTGYRRVYVVGSKTNLAESGLYKDWWIKSFDRHGYEYTKREGWDKEFGTDFGDSEALSVAVDNDGRVIVVGYRTTGFEEKKEAVIQKYHADGRLIYEGYLKHHLGDVIPYGVTTDTNRNIIVVGCSPNMWGRQDWLIVKLSPSFIGDPLVITASGSQNHDESAYAVVTDKNNNIYVVGSRYLTALNRYQWWVRKYNPSGGLLATRTFSGLGHAVPYSIAVDDKDSDNPYLFVVGYTTNPGTGKDWWIKKLRSSNLLEITEGWNQQVTSPGNHDDIAYSVQVFDPDPSNPLLVKRVVVGGSRYSDDTNLSDWFINIYYAEGPNEGDLVSSIEYNNPGDDTILAMAVDEGPRQANFYVVGYGTNITHIPDHNTLKDWWLKKFTSNEKEITTGVSIDSLIWNMSNLPLINQMNRINKGNVIIPIQKHRDHWVIPYDFQIPTTPDGEEALYVVEIRLNIIPKSDRILTGSLIFLSDINGSYDTASIPSHYWANSYGVSIAQIGDGRAYLNLTRYSHQPPQPPTSNVLESVEIPAPFTLFNDHIIMRSYLKINNSTTPYTAISTYLYTSVTDHETYAPFEEHFSLKHTVNNRLSGYLGIVTHKHGHGDPYQINDWISVDFIGVYRLAPSYQPTSTVGAMESINYGWMSPDQNRISVDRHQFDPFSPDPVNRDYVNVTDNDVFFIKNLPSLHSTPGDFSIDYIVTLTIGDTHFSSPEYTLEWESKAHNDAVASGLILLPATKQGEIRQIWFSIEFPQREISTSLKELTLKFTTDDSAATKPVTSIMIERKNFLSLTGKPIGEV